MELLSTVTIVLLNTVLCSCTITAQIFQQEEKKLTSTAMNEKCLAFTILASHTEAPRHSSSDSLLPYGHLLVRSEIVMSSAGDN